MNNEKNNEHRIIPFNWCPTKFYIMDFHGWYFSDDPNDSTFEMIMLLIQKTVDNFISIYKDTHAISDPDISLNPQDGIVRLKIATMENERYNYLLEKDEKANS